MSGGIDLLRLCSPLTSHEEVRAILDRTRTPDPQPRPVARRPRRRVAPDVRQRIYVPPAGSIAWSLLGGRVIR